MKMLNENGEQFELRVDGYMAEYTPDKYFESNWLRGEIVLSNKRVEERVSLQFLQVEELIKLEEWISGIEKGDKSTRTIFDFIDPNMRFRLWERGKVESVRFIYHSEKKDIYHWEMLLNEKNVMNFCEQLEQTIKRFPIR
jgi:hypothetical protein